jgi:hypothetical protein
MIQYLNKLEEERKLLLDRTKDLTVDQYNIIPTGFNNNIIWNMGHILVVSEDVLYGNSPYQRPVHQFAKSRFQKGSAPDEIIGEDDISLLRHSLQQTAQFYKRCSGMDRSGYEIPSASDTGMTIVGDEIMRFLLFHEDMHYRKIARLSEIVRK